MKWHEHQVITMNPSQQYQTLAQQYQTYWLGPDFFSWHFGIFLHFPRDSFFLFHPFFLHSEIFIFHFLLLWNLFLAPRSVAPIPNSVFLLHHMTKIDWGFKMGLITKHQWTLPMLYRFHRYHYQQPHQSLIIIFFSSCSPKNVFSIWTLRTRNF